MSRIENILKEGYSRCCNRTPRIDNIICEIEWFLGIEEREKRPGDIDVCDAEDWKIYGIIISVYADESGHQKDYAHAHVFMKDGDQNDVGKFPIVQNKPTHSVHIKGSLWKDRKEKVVFWASGYKNGTNNWDRLKSAWTSLHPNIPISFQ